MSDDSKALLQVRVVAGQPSLEVEVEKSQVVHLEVPEYENDGTVPFTNHAAMIRLLHKLMFTAQTVSMMPINKKKFDDEVICVIPSWGQSEVKIVLDLNLQHFLVLIFTS